MKRIRHLAEFAKHFLKMEAAGGIVMLAFAALAIVLANSAFSGGYQAIITLPLGEGATLTSFTKDVLMAIFFFAVGMELKCEMREGALSQPGQKLLPLIAAAGGIILPAALYLAITAGHPETRAGWAIPTATDIAFALCVLRLAGPALPQPAKIFLLAIAIYDDLAAILIVALFYSSGISLVALSLVALLVAVMAYLNHREVSRILPYLLLGVALWFAVREAGIHPTVAGVISGVMIPMRARTSAPLLAPLLHHLHPYVAFGILPLFAFTSAGVDMRGLALNDLFAALPMGIVLALFFGKQIGIFGATYACVKLGLAPLPKGVNWRMVYGVSIIAGIGFTMSLFIGKLAFPNGALGDAVKLGVIAGSLLSSLWGLLYLRLRWVKTSSLGA
jgi:NhaA family Na+:H+ antiporter